MFETIVVPLDGSDLAEAALNTATELATRLHASVVLVQAIDSLAQRLAQPAAIGGTPAVAAVNVDVLQEALEAEKAASERYLASRRDELTTRGVTAEAYVGEGNPADVIEKLAEDKGAGIIVMSTHGRGGLGRLVFGSVADAILRHSQIPVLLIRSREEHRS
jgi:nucleotide-binding universal stress UspA family protein